MVYRREGRLTNRPGVSGFGIIALILVLIVIGYVAFMIAGVHFNYGAVKGKVEDAAELGPTQSDEDIIAGLVRDAQEAHVNLTPEQVYIDHSIPDSFRIYIAYDDSTSIFGLFLYRKHFVVDVVERISGQ